jgi:hypothetical protein
MECQLALAVTDHHHNYYALELLSSGVNVI